MPADEEPPRDDGGDGARLAHPANGRRRRALGRSRPGARGAYAAPVPAPRARLSLAGQRRIPFGIIAVAALRVVDAISIASIAVGRRPFPLSSLPSPLADTHVVMVVVLAWAGAALLGVIGLLLLRSWGWILTMVMVGVGLASALAGWYGGTPDYLELLLLVVTAFYLNQGSARSLGERGDAADDGPEAT